MVVLLSLPLVFVVVIDGVVSGCWWDIVIGNVVRMKQLLLRGTVRRYL